MKGYYRHILLASAALLAAASCTKTRVEEIPSEPMPISISAVDGAATKALLDNGTFKQTDTKALIESEVAFAADGNRIQVYSYANGGYYFSDLIGPDVPGSAAAEATAGVWPFVNGPHNWSSGTHRFYGWLVNDVNGTEDDLNPASLFGNTFTCVTGTDKNVTMEAFNTTTQTLTIPAKEMTADTPQFDFMYSDIFTTEPINAPVQLKFSHLFCAVSFGISNGDTQDIEIKSLNVSTYNSMSATIDFTGEDTHITYTKSSTSTGVFRSLNNAYTLQGGGNCDNAFNSTSSGKDFRLLWPMTSDELKDCRITVTYLYKSDNAQYTKELAFPDPAAAGLLAGNRYHYSIGLPSLKTTQVTIKCEVCPWDTANTDITFN